MFSDEEMFSLFATLVTIFTFTSKEELQEAVDMWCDEKTREEAEEKYGNISDWDVSQITDMSGLFAGKDFFNDDISRWDVSNVTNMENMFKGACSFNQPINTWNVSKVSSMSCMFKNANEFNRPLDKWNTKSVVDMSGMFLGAKSFNQPINTKRTYCFFYHTNYMAWKVTKVTFMKEMFRNASKFNQSIRSWDVENVVDMCSMFYGAKRMEKPKKPSLMNL